MVRWLTVPEPDDIQTSIEVEDGQVTVIKEVLLVEVPAIGLMLPNERAWVLTVQAIAWPAHRSRAVPTSQDRVKRFGWIVAIRITGYPGR